MRHSALSAFMLLGVVAAGPAAAAGDDISQYRQKLSAEGDQNWVLNQLEIGARSLWSGDCGVAGAAFDDAIEKIELVFSADAAAAKARSLWHEEGAKNFKGEPYERAMAYYYRGLCYLQAADYENARAAFRQGQLQDAFAEEEQFQTDFALLLFLEAWASHLNGDDDLRDETLRHLKVLRPDFPGIGADDDALLLVETGTAPRKLGDGLNHSYFVFRRGRGFKENRAAVELAGAALPLYPMEDIYFQATTRGGREIDQILEGKAKFRNAGTGVSRFLSDSSVIISQMGGGAELAGAAAGLGFIAAIAAFSAKPKADTRQWTSLPDTVHVLTYSSGARDLNGASVQFFRGEEKAEHEGRPITVRRDANGAGLALIRSR